MNETTDLNNRLPFLAVAFTLGLCFLFGANAVAIKIALKGLGVFTTAGIRFGIACIAIFIWAIITGQPLRIRKNQIIPLLILCLVFTVQLSLFYFGISKTNASRGTLLINLQPFFILFLAHFFIPGDRITRRKLIGLLLGFSGVAFVFLEKTGVTADLQFGDFIILTASFIWACNGIYTKRIVGHFEPFQLVFYPMLFSIPFFFMEAFFWDPSMVIHIDIRVLLSILYQSLVTASFGFIAWTTLLRTYGAVALHSFVFIMPIAGVLLGGLLLGEPITPKLLFALLLIVSGILAVHLKYKPRIPLLHIGRNV